MTFRINRVYTRSGDDGLTGLVGGPRLPKQHPRVAAYGDVDELNSVLGSLRASLSANTLAISPILIALQQELFDLGSELATPPDGGYEGMWHVGAGDVTRLELLCDTYGEGLPELQSFILPGGSVPAAWCHMARTVCRRAERTALELQATVSNPAEWNQDIIRYLNRFSDLMFVLARWCLRQDGLGEPLWVPANKRSNTPQN